MVWQQQAEPHLGLDPGPPLACELILGVTDCLCLCVFHLMTAACQGFTLPVL